MNIRLDHMVSLSAQAFEVLQALQEVTGNEKLMFPGLRSPLVPIEIIAERNTCPAVPPLKGRDSGTQHLTTA